MRVLLTSGGTRVPIDRVRDIRNMSMGTFGSRIALELLRLNARCDRPPIDELPSWIRDAVTYRVAMDPPLSVSSTLVRHRIQAELSVRFLVPDVVIPIIDAWTRST